MRMEGVLYQDKIPGLSGMFRTGTALGMGHDPTKPVLDWTMIDFDNCLRGNPHIQITKEK